jgi:hypothetical protein
MDRPKIETQSCRQLNGFHRTQLRSLVAYRWRNLQLQRKGVCSFDDPWPGFVLVGSLVITQVLYLHQVWVGASIKWMGGLGV